MSDFSKLTSKILDEAEKQSKEIIETAEKEAKSKYDKVIEKAKNEIIKLEDKAEKDRILIADRIHSNTALKIRNDKLAAKQFVIDKVINKLKDELSKLDEISYINYLKSKLTENNLTDESILIVKKEYLNNVKKEFPDAHILTDKFVNSGFILEKNGVQENYTFDVQVDFMRDELEIEISQFLF